MKRTVMVTGASGFVGGHVIDALLAAGHAPDEVVAVGRGPLPDLVHARPLDLLDKKDVGEAVATLKPTAVIHLAAVALPAAAKRDAEQAWAVNVNATRWLAEAISRHAPAARFVFAGSSESYGRSFQSAAGPIAETAPLKPMSAYGATKAAAELMLLQMVSDGLDAVAFRAFNHTGPGQSADYVVSSFASQIARAEAGSGPASLRVGNLEARRDFCDVRDVARAYVLATDRVLGGIDDRVLNVCSGTARRIGDVLDGLVGMADAAIDIELDPARLRPAEIPMAVGDPSAACRVLGWSPTIEFEATLRDVLTSWRRVQASENPS